MSSEEREDARLERLVGRLIPVVKTRVLRALEHSPETLEEEIWTLAALYAIRANLAEG
jgi:chaperonin cofactor prefoldin